MNPDRSWNALLKPGSADDYFYDVNDLSSVRKNDFNSHDREYNIVNAWWLSEMCRLIYRQGPEESGIFAHPVTRNDFLEKAGFEEGYFLNSGTAQCSVILPGANQELRYSIIVFRGTNCFENWFNNLNTGQVRWPWGGGLVHNGFKYEFDRLWIKIEEVLEIIPFPVFYTGHSLGAALATLAASKIRPFALYTFGSPRVGNAEFAETVKGVNIFRHVNGQDIVTKVPPSVKGFRYCHAGKQYNLEYKKEKGFYRQKTGMLLDTVFKHCRKLVLPPLYLSDHAPFNYSAQLSFISPLLKSE